MGKLYIIPVYEQREEIAEYAKREDLQFEYNDFFLPSVLDDPDFISGRVKAYRSLGRDLSKDTMHGAFFDVTVFSYDKEIARISEERMRQSMQIAGELGVRGVVFHGNYLPFLQRESYDNNWILRTEESLRRILAEFPETEIFMENMFDSTPEMLRRLAERLTDEKQFGLCFDYSHAILAGGMAETWMKELSPYIRHMHINDHCYAGDDHLVPGDGKNDWKLYDRLVRAYAPDTTTLVEVKNFEESKHAVKFLRDNRFYPVE